MVVHVLSQIHAHIVVASGAALFMVEVTAARYWLLLKLAWKALEATSKYVACLPGSKQQLLVLYK